MRQTLNIEVTKLDSGSFRAEIPETFLFWIDKDEAEAVRIVTEMYKHVCICITLCLTSKDKNIKYCIIVGVVLQLHRNQ